jgi:Acetyltransferase (isoleucine patch superfamily)
MYIRVKIARFYLNEIGDDCALLMGVKFKAPWGIKVGNNTVINSGVTLDGRGGLSILDNVDVAQDVLIWTMTHDFNFNHHVIAREVVIYPDVWIGARSQILPGVNIHKGAVIGCGSVVTTSVSSLSIVAGVPAKIIGMRNKDYDYKLSYSPWFQ